jgi:hypothetical protein
VRNHLALLADLFDFNLARPGFRLGWFSDSILILNPTLDYREVKDGKSCAEWSCPIIEFHGSRMAI